MCKIMESMIAERLKWFLKEYQIIHPCQSGFRSDRSTLDNILALHDDIYRNIQNKRTVVTVFLDIERAYDTVWRKGLLAKLFALGLRGRFLRWTSAFLSQRTFQVRVGSELSGTFDVENGIVQGSVLSPILFTLMINDLPDNIINSKALFADDCAIWDAGLVVENTVKSIQDTLDTITEWCKKWGFRLSPTKSNVVVFSRKRILPPINLQIDGCTLPVCDTFRYLGVTFDKKLNYKSHIDLVERKCMKRINILKMVSGTHWGASKGSMLAL